MKTNTPRTDGIVLTIAWLLILATVIMHPTHTIYDWLIAAASWGVAWVLMGCIDSSRRE